MPATDVDPASDDEEGGLYTCGGSSDNLEAMKKALCVCTCIDLKESAAGSEIGCCRRAGALERAAKEHTNAPHLGFALDEVL